MKIKKERETADMLLSGPEISHNYIGKLSYQSEVESVVSVQ